MFSFNVYSHKTSNLSIIVHFIYLCAQQIITCTCIKLYNYKHIVYCMTKIQSLKFSNTCMRVSTFFNNGNVRVNAILIDKGIWLKIVGVANVHIVRLHIIIDIIVGRDWKLCVHK